jgi:hypothetical protein
MDCFSGTNGCVARAAQVNDGIRKRLMPYVSRSLTLHLSFTLCYNLVYYNQLDLVGRLCFFLYLAILVIYGLLLSNLRTCKSPHTYLNALNAAARVATLLCLNAALPSWTLKSGSCTPDFWRYLLLGTGIIGLNFNTLFFPLPGEWQLPVQVVTTAIFVQTHSSRTCGILLTKPVLPCNYSGYFAALWPLLSGAGQSLAALLSAYVDKAELDSLDVSQQCQVGVVWLQVCLGGLFPCLLQCALGFDNSLQRFMGELPGRNKVLVYAALTLQLVGLLWRASYFWGLSLLHREH